ncbi:MAG: glycoside hydrolase family 5 protein [Verrucomicrobiota bacterium]
MNTSHPYTPPRRALLRPLAALLATAIATTSATAADWFLDKSQARYSSWETLADWKPNADGTGTSPTALSTADTYHLNGFMLRTPEGGSTYTFGGGLLSLTHNADNFALKTTGAGVAIIPSLLTSAGLIQNVGSGTQNLQVGHYENRSGTTAFNAPTGRGISLAIDTLTGSGQFRLYGGGTHYLDLANAHAYDGEIYVQSGTVDFNSDVNSAGHLTINTGAKVALDQSVTFTGLTVAGTEYPVGDYSYVTLQAAHPAVFVSGTAGGFINVRAPRDWYLSTHQPVGASWNTLAHWRSNPDGTGDTAVAINSFDNYINQVSGRNLRTPEVTATFGGGALVLADGGNLVLKAPAGKSSTIPGFATSGTVSIVNGFSHITQPLIIGDWHLADGISQISVPTNNTVQLTVDKLSGDGTLRFQNTGRYKLALRGGQDFTGTVNASSGTLTIDAQIGTGGDFVVGSTAAVKLEHPGFFTAVDVDGTTLASGYHTYAALKAAHPSRFPYGSTDAFLAVYPPDTTGPAHMFGVNLAGGEFGGPLPGTYGYDYIYPSAAAFDYYQSKGLNLIRLPFKWERIQHTLGGSLNAAELARLDTVVGYASARGMKVILDMHNYARRKVSGTNYLIGTGPVTIDHLGDVWRRLADHYKGNSAIYGYGIMNEPFSTNNTWPQMAQTAVNAIRTVDLTTYVLVSGDGWGNATGWRSKNPNLDTQDPVGRLIYEAHCYFDNNLSGTYDQSYDGEGAYPMIGVDRVKEFVEWLQETGNKGFIGEYGVPGNDSRWLTVLDNFLAYLDANGVSGTYWAGGPWWGSYPLSCEPTSNYTVDKPQMSILEDYN